MVSNNLQFSHIIWVLLIFASIELFVEGLGRRTQNRINISSASRYQQDSYSSLLRTRQGS